MKETFVVYTAYLERFAKLSDEQMGKLFRAMMAYQKTGEDPVLDDFAVEIAFGTIRYDMDANNEKYDEICRKRREAASLGGKQKVANASKRKQMVANGSTRKQLLPIYDNDNDNENVNDNDNDNGAFQNTNVLQSSKKKVEAKASKKETIDALVAKWNSYADRGNIPTVKTVSVDGMVGKSVIARVEENGLPVVEQVLDEVFASDYLRGMKIDWCANFSWVFKPSNFEKVLNGNYTNTKPKGKSQAQADFLLDWINERSEENEA